MHLILAVDYLFLASRNLIPILVYAKDATWVLSDDFEPLGLELNFGIFDAERSALQAALPCCQDWNCTIQDSSRNPSLFYIRVFGFDSDARLFLFLLVILDAQGYTFIMSFEKRPTPRIPEKNDLPLKINGQEHIAESGESSVFRADVQDSKEKERTVALKQNRREVFASDEEMRKSKEFYDFLKTFPGFGKFVPETLYFKARMTSDSAPQSFAIQYFLKGRTIDQIPNDELYKDTVVVKQLIEFAHEAIAILQQTREDKSLKPDFGTAGTADVDAQRYWNTFGNSRYTTNILISDSPDENGQRVFFVDTGVNADERVDPKRQFLERHVMGRMREFNFNRWIKELEKILDSKGSRVTPHTPVPT